MAYLYPYGDTQQLNLDWLIEQWNEVKSQIDGSLQAEIDRVEAAITDLLTARNEAVAAQTAAQASAQAAAGSASTASGAASTATAQAQAAAGSAATAGAHASDAQGYAATAQQSAQAAHNDAAAAAVSAGNAHNDAQAAHTDALAAAGSASSASADALKAEGFAVGEQNGSPVTSGSPYYENNAEYFANEAATVAASIPADYSLLSETVDAISSPYITDWFNMDNDDLDVIGNPSASNFRTPWVHKNRFGAKGRALNGQTYFSYLITGNTAKYVGTTFNSIIQTLTATDFTPIEITPEYRLNLKVRYKGRGLQNNNHNGGGIVFVTYDSDTQTVIGSSSVVGLFGVTRQGANIFKHIDFKVDIGAYLPEIYTTKNIAIVYQTRTPDIEEEFIIEPCLDWIGWGASRYIGDYEKSMALQSPSFIALRNYAANDFVIIGANLYKVTQAIATGETIVPNTNCVYTTLGQEITAILNS